MKPATDFDAYWLPSFDSEADPDKVLAVGFDWLRRAERAAGVRGVLAMYAKSMRHNRPIIAAAPWDIVSPRSRAAYRIRGPVLAIWPNGRVLELAESMAMRSALCVIPYKAKDIAAWIERTGAKPVIEGLAPPARAAVAPEIEEELRYLVHFGGHNGFLGGGEKEVVIGAFHRIARVPGAPSREALEDYLRTTGEVDADGVTRAGSWWQEVLEGKRHRDHRGQIIR